MNIDFNKTLCFTGHRPNKLYGYDYRIDGNRRMLLKLRAIIERFIDKRGVTTFISGMALGIDTWSAQIILQLKNKYPNIKLVCAIPCANQSDRWREEDKEIHADILSQADYVHYVSEAPYTNWCMTDRDKWMVDQSRFVLSVFNGDKNGGTWQTVKYATKRQRTILNLHPETYEVTI